MRYIFFVYVGIILPFLFFGCARKQKNIFDFSEKEKTSFNKLNFPVVNFLSAEKKGNNVFLSWQKIKDDFNLNQDKSKVIFVGYNIYRFIESGFVPKNPLNKKPLVSNNFCDVNVLKFKNNNCSIFSYCYLIRAVFKIQDKVYLGPSSRVICVK